MTNIFIQGIIILLLWVGGWGIAEMFVDSVAKDNQTVRFATYIVMILIALLLLWIVDTIVDD